MEQLKREALDAGLHQLPQSVGAQVPLPGRGDDQVGLGSATGFTLASLTPSSATCAASVVEARRQR